MAGVAIGTIFIAYWLGLTGYLLLRGYDVTQKQLWASTWPPVQAKKGKD